MSRLVRHRSFKTLRRQHALYQCDNRIGSQSDPSICFCEARLTAAPIAPIVFLIQRPFDGVCRNPEKPRRPYVEYSEFCAFLKFGGQKSGESKRKYDGYLLLCVTAQVAGLTNQRREDVVAVPLRNARDDGILFKQKKSKGEMRVPDEWTDALRVGVAKAKALPRPVSGLYLICNRRGQSYADRSPEGRGAR